MNKYDFLVNYLKERINNCVFLDKDELKRILTALGVKFDKE